MKVSKTARLSVSAERASGCIQLAILLEVSAHPKPGNVHRTADFPRTRYEHFLASAVAVAPHLRLAVKRGVMISNKEIDLARIGIGEIIKDAVQEVDSWQHGGNTLLGTILLLSPIAVSAGMSVRDNFSINTLRKNLRTIIKSTTSQDTVNVYDAISIARPGGLGKAPRLDVTDPTSKHNILDNSVTLFDVFEIASKYDSIASEWVNDYRITFDVGYPYLVSQLEEINDINVVTVNTFLKILSEVPDTLIARKAGIYKSREVSAQALDVLEKGGLSSREGKILLQKLDEDLRHDGHELNPGTTADITSAVLAVHLLSGYRP